ncbi:TonB-dependent siderophore receptor [Shewanella sp. OPT22]|nr:TonB-dependent siderophore receptor [Shewanella sp. OPT22]
MKIKSLPFAISVALSSLSLQAFAESANIEVIQVKGTYFNDYKVTDATGATRTNTSLLETPQSITVIPETIIDEQLATTLGEVLSNDASLSAGSKQRNREVFNSRGFQLSSSTGYLRDGHQHWSHYQQPIETLSRVEVIKGPASILYGQSAPGGLINMVTKKPTAKKLLDLGFDTDLNGSTRFMLDAGGEIVQDINYRTVLVKQDVNYTREYQNGEQRNRDRFLGSLALDYQITDDLLVNVYYDQTNDKAGLDTGAWLDADGKVIGSDKTIYDFSWAFTDIEVNNIGATASYFITDNWSVKLGYNEQSFKRQRFESSPSRPENYSVGDSYDSKPYDRFDDWQFKTTYLDLTGEIEIAKTQHQLLFGINRLDYSYGQLRTKAGTVSFTPGQVEPTRPDISYKTDDSLYSSEYDYYGVYFQDLVTFNDNWQLMFGGRYDQQNRKDANNTSFVPKFGVLFHPNDDATLYINYSEGFEPSSSDTLNNTDDKNHGMKLDAVTSKQIEFGAKWQVTDRLLVDTAVFDIEKSGTLITEDIIDNPDYKTITTQSGLQRHKGFEVSAQGAVNDRFFLMASSMYLDAVYERDAKYQGKRPVDAPKLSASIWSRYEATEQLAINAGIFYQGERFADTANNITKDAYTRVDFGATYKTSINGIAVDYRFNIENLFDTEYLAGGGTNNVTIGGERMARLEVKASF